MKAFLKSRFDLLAEWISAALGRPLAFLAAVAIVALWAISGPVFGYSDTWQLVINTGTTISTFLMVFLLQNTGGVGVDEGNSLVETCHIQSRCKARDSLGGLVFALDEDNVLGALGLGLRLALYQGLLL